jgi:hypothetical protein
MAGRLLSLLRLEMMLLLDMNFPRLKGLSSLVRSARRILQQESSFSQPLKQYYIQEPSQQPFQLPSPQPIQTPSQLLHVPCGLLLRQPPSQPSSQGLSGQTG